MMINISFLNVPLDVQGLNGKDLDLEKWNNSKLKDLMWLTAQPLYQNVDIEFSQLIDIVKSDYRQYSPFEFKDKTKKSENWQNDKQNLLILDVDDGLSIKEAESLFQRFNYLLATTKSHQKDKGGKICDRFRLILPSDDIPRGEKFFDFARILEKKYPFIDKQVNTKAGAFLGFFECEFKYNNGENFNCSELINTYERIQKATMVEKTHVNIPKKQNYDKSADLPIQDIKSRLTRETVADIVSYCGYEVNRKFMFKYRQSERTPSASISPELLIKDFGSELSTDIIGFVQEVKGVDFKTATEIVGGFVNVQIA